MLTPFCSADLIPVLPEYHRFPLRGNIFFSISHVSFVASILEQSLCLFSFMTLASCRTQFRLVICRMPHQFDLPNFMMWFGFKHCWQEYHRSTVLKVHFRRKCIVPLLVTLIEINRFKAWSAHLLAGAVVLSFSIPWGPCSTLSKQPVSQPTLTLQLQHPDTFLPDSLGVTNLLPPIGKAFNFHPVWEKPCPPVAARVLGNALLCCLCIGIYSEQSY